MRSRHRAQREGWFGRGRTRAILCLATVGALAYTSSTAYWTDDVQVTGTTFTSGTLDLLVNDADPYSGATVLSMTDMTPGHSSAQVLTVRNGGSVPAKYTLNGGLTGSGAANFSAAGPNGLLLTIRAGGSVVGSGTARTCTGGTLVYSSTPLTDDTTTNLLVKRPASALPPGGTEALCFQVVLASGAPSSLQGQTASAQFTATGTSDVS